MAGPLSQLLVEVSLISGRRVAVGRRCAHGVRAQCRGAGVLPLSRVTNGSFKIQVRGIILGKVFAGPHPDRKLSCLNTALIWAFYVFCNAEAPALCLWCCLPCSRRCDITQPRSRSGRLGSRGPTCAGLLLPPPWSLAPPPRL